MLKRQRQEMCFTLGLVTLTFCVVGVAGCAPSNTPSIRAEQNVVINDTANGSVNTSNARGSHEQIHENVAEQDGSAQLSNRQSTASAVSKQENSLQLGFHGASSAVLGPQRFMPGDIMVAKGE